ncbi:MAG: type IV secretory system conjugative DNA transfer family protein, partial [Zavarzinia sp.]|nr:type IV secretory system conjugative DNA transfer family protein [Zavarzinia sp.]
AAQPVGVIVGKFVDKGRQRPAMEGRPVPFEKGTILAYSGPEHHLVTGASRAGKGVGHVVPTLLTWAGSVLVYDPKAELYDITAGFRSKFSHAFFLNFTRDDSAAFNPLFEVRKGPNEVADVQNVVSILIDPSGTKQELSFWDQSASDLLTAIILHQLYAAPDDEKNLAAVRAALLDFDATLLRMSHTYHRFKPGALDEKGERVPEVYPEIRLVAMRFLEMEKKIKDSIVATCLACLVLWSDPRVAAKTSRSDFTIGDLVCSDAPCSCYIQAPPSDADRLKPLTRLILSQVSKSLMAEIDRDARGRPKRHKLLFLIDEFPTLGKLGFFETNLRVMAGYGIKAMLIVQSFKDIAAAYGQNNTIVDNCHVIVAFATADSDTAARIATMTGKAVEYRESRSRSTGVFSRGSDSRSLSEVQRELLTPGEVRALDYGDQLIFVTGSPPFRTRKVRYYQEPIFQARATDIRAGGKGPDQAQRLDVPAIAATPWAGVAPVAEYQGPISETAAPEPVGDLDAVAAATGADFSQFSAVFPDNFE